MFHSTASPALTARVFIARPLTLKAISSGPTSVLQTAIEAYWVIERVPMEGRLRLLSDYGAAERGCRRMIARGVRVPDAPAEILFGAAGRIPKRLADPV